MGQWRTRDGHCRKPDGRLRDRGCRQRGRWRWRGNRRRSSSTSRWDLLRKSACRETQIHPLSWPLPSNSPFRMQFLTPSAPFSLQINIYQTNSLLKLMKFVKMKLTVVPDVSGNDLSLSAPWIEGMNDRLKRVVSGLLNRGELKVWLVVDLLVITLPHGCLLVVWVYSGHCWWPHHVCSPFLSVLAWRFRQRIWRLLRIWFFGLGGWWRLTFWCASHGWKKGTKELLAFLGIKIRTRAQFGRWVWRGLRFYRWRWYGESAHGLVSFAMKHMGLVFPEGAMFVDTMMLLDHATYLFMGPHSNFSLRFPYFQRVYQRFI